ncbi:MAG: hypothetical protein R6W92_08665 [Desulfocurvibacter africanus]
MAGRQPAFPWGAPGVGKSQVVVQVAAKHGLELVDIRAVLLDPVDLRGIPRIDEAGNAVWSSPSFLPRKGRGILFLDELNTAPPLVQAACNRPGFRRRADLAGGQGLRGRERGCGLSKVNFISVFC